MTRYSLAVLIAVVTAVPAAAQQTPADVISFLVTNQSVQTGDFEKDRAAAAATRDTIARALQANLATVPIATLEQRLRLSARSRARDRIARHRQLRHFFCGAGDDQRARARIVRRLRRRPPGTTSWME